METSYMNQFYYTRNWELQVIYDQVGVVVLQYKTPQQCWQELYIAAAQLVIASLCAVYMFPVFVYATFVIINTVCCIVFVTAFCGYSGIKMAVCVAVIAKDVSTLFIHPHSVNFIAKTKALV